MTMRLHHVGYAVREIETVAETYVRRYGYELASGVIHDPAQTAYVQFLRLPGDASYLELVAPDGPASKLARVVERRGVLHHLCYATNALDAAIERLREDGMLLFSDPRPAVAFGGRRICWMIGQDAVLIELVEGRDAGDECLPGAE